MTNAIEGLEARLNDLPADLVDDAIRVFTTIAERNGGKMIRGKYQLTAKVKKRYNTPGGAWVLMVGVPSGFWTWRETGTASHEIRPKKRRRGKRSGWTPGPMGGGLNAAVGHPIWGPVTHPGIAAPLLWTKTCKEADVAIEELTRRALAKAVA